MVEPNLGPGASLVVGKWEPEQGDYGAEVVADPEMGHLMVEPNRGPAATQVGGKGEPEQQ